MRLRSLPRCRAGPGRMRQGSSGAGVVLAAIVGTPADRRAPREGGDGRNGTVSGLRRLPRRGAEALRRSTSPPQGFLLPFSYTHRPGRSALHGPAGSGVDVSIPQNSFVWVLLKMGPLARSHAQRCNGPPQRLPGSRTSQTAYPAPQLAYPAPPSPSPKSPTLHLSHHVPSRCTKFIPPPNSPTLHPSLPTDLPCTPTRLPCTSLSLSHHVPSRCTKFIPPPNPPTLHRTPGGDEAAVSATPPSPHRVATHKHHPRPP